MANTDQQTQGGRFREHIEKQVDKYPFISPSAIVLMFYYMGGQGRFDQLRSLAEQHKSIYLNPLNHDTHSTRR